MARTCWNRRSGRQGPYGVGTAQEGGGSATNASGAVTSDPGKRDADPRLFLFLPTPLRSEPRAARRVVVQLDGLSRSGGSEAGENRRAAVPLAAAHPVMRRLEGRGRTARGQWRTRRRMRKPAMPQTALPLAAACGRNPRPRSRAADDAAKPLAGDAARVAWALTARPPPDMPELNRTGGEERDDRTTRGNRCRQRPFGRRDRRACASLPRRGLPQQGLAHPARHHDQLGGGRAGRRAVDPLYLLRMPRPCRSSSSAC